MEGPNNNTKVAISLQIIGLVCLIISSLVKLPLVISIFGFFSILVGGSMYAQNVWIRYREKLKNDE